MQKYLQAAQADVSRQFEETTISTHPSAVKKIMAIGAFALLSSFSLGAHAQMDPYDSRGMSDAANRMGNSIGQEVGRNSNLGNPIGQLLGVGAGTVAKLVGGQEINGADIGGTMGQVAGALLGYAAVGGNKASALKKTLGVVGVGAVGGILGGTIGRAVDGRNAQQAMDAHNGGSPAIQLNAQDQQNFLNAMQSSANARGRGYQPQQVSNNGYQPQQVSNNGYQQQNYQQQNGYQQASNRQISPEQAGFRGFLGQAFSRNGLQLIASGTNQMPDNAMVGVANKAMELIKVGQAYTQTNNAWDEAFMTNQPPVVKNQINVALLNTDALLKAKLTEYSQSRNAAASRGYDVSLMDGAIFQQLQDVRPPANYGFQTSYRASNRP